MITDQQLNHYHHHPHPHYYYYYYYHRRHHWHCWRHSNYRSAENGQGIGDIITTIVSWRCFMYLIILKAFFTIFDA